MSSNTRADASTLPLPTGTLTFLLTDIEGSTRMWQAAPEAMQSALARHDAILRQGNEAHGGREPVCVTPGSGAVEPAPDAGWRL